MTASTSNLLNALITGMLLVAFHFSTIGQFAFERDQSIPVIVDKQGLPNAWAGGLTAPQWSSVDVNFDGHPDLFLFDRDGNRPIIFVNESPIAGEMQYRYAPEYADDFPDLRDWALLRDFDGDGLPDIFTGFQSSIRVWKNVSTPESGLAFELHTPQLSASFDFGNGPSVFPLVCLSIDIPSIVDYDGDGDLDIVTFTEAATTLYFFKNMAVENGEPDTFDFVCTNRCYGMAAEGTEDNTVFYGDDFVCPFNVLNPRKLEHQEPDWVTGGPRHAGGTLLSIDLDGNGIKDLVVGDSGFTSLQAWLMEDAVDGQDSTAFVDLTFPSLIAGDTPLDLYRFPASFYLDINNDQVPDLVASPNSRFQANDFEGAWLYLNEGTETGPDFNWVQSDFLQEGMIDLGTGAYPVLFDHNGDGLLDLVIANQERYLDGQSERGRLVLYQNIGTDSDPSFELINDNWLNIINRDWLSPYPAFGDLDGDGLEDLVIGNQHGDLFFAKNTSEPGFPATFEFEEVALIDANTLTTIDVGQFSTPQLVDVDGDGLLDLLVGAKVGTLFYYRNTGTAENFAFERVMGDTDGLFGGITVENFLGINGYSVPHLYRNSDGTSFLFVGNETGTIELYDDITNNLAGNFNRITERVENLQEGYRCGVHVNDLNNDGFPDLLYGIGRGGVMYFKGIDPNVNVPEPAPVQTLLAFPNPASDAFTLRFPELTSGTLEVYDLTGRMVISETRQPSHRQVVNTNQLSQGTYIVMLRATHGTYTAKVVVSR